MDLETSLKEIERLKEQIESSFKEKLEKKTKENIELKEQLYEVLKEKLDNALKENKDLKDKIESLLNEQKELKAKGADLSNRKIAGKFDGYSEAWSKYTFQVKSIKELMRLTEEFEDDFEN